MWRWIVLALVAANGAFWLWSHGALRAFNLGPIEVAEPARLKAQIHPEALQVTPQEPTPAVTATPASTPEVAAAPASTPVPAPLQPTAPTGAAPAVPALAPATALGK